MIEVKNLSKRYRNNSFYSLKDVSFSINKGEIVGLIGKNGAGKSTLLKLMAKSLRPTSGTVLYQGKDIYQHVNILTDFGIMIEPVFYSYLTVEENICTYLEIYHQKSDFEDILRLVDLWDVRRRKPASFSFGYEAKNSLSIDA